MTSYIFVRNRPPICVKLQFEYAELWMRFEEKIWSQTEGNLFRTVQMFCIWNQDVHTGITLWFQRDWMLREKHTQKAQDACLHLSTCASDLELSNPESPVTHRLMDLAHLFLLPVLLPAKHMLPYSVIVRSVVMATLCASVFQLITFVLEHMNEFFHE